MDGHYFIVFFLGSIGLLLWKRRDRIPGVSRFQILSLGFTICSEFAFTSYVSVYGKTNLVGHFLRLIAFYLLYKAIIETGLVKPYAILLGDLKLSQDQLRENAAALQARNGDLTRSESQLREDAAILKSRNEELDVYAHTVAHNLKNPLSVIIAAAELINEIASLTHKERQEYLLNIMSTAYEMDNIIDNLLLLSEVRKVEAPSETVDMAKVVDNVRNHLDYMIKEHRSRLSYPKVRPTVIGHGPWIEEVWANYLGNALKYGGQSPRIELGGSPGTDGMVRFWARDDGPGLSPEAQACLLTPFTQLRKAHKMGHGLGLSIVLRIVEKLGSQ